MSCCPYISRQCNLEQRYNTTGLTADVINAIAGLFEDGDDAFEAMKIASAKEYLGDMCVACGSFFPATTIIVENG